MISGNFIAQPAALMDFRPACLAVSMSGDIVVRVSSIPAPKIRRPG